MSHHARRQPLYFLLPIAALAGLFATTGCEPKPNCTVLLRFEEVGDEKRPVFAIANTGANDPVGATLIVEGEVTLTEGGTKLSGPFSAGIDKVNSGKQRQIGQSLLRAADGKTLDGALATKTYTVRIADKDVCTGVVAAE